MSMSPTSEEYAREVCALLKLDPDEYWGDLNNALCDAYEEGSRSVLFRAYGSSIVRAGSKLVTLSFMEKLLGTFDPDQIKGFACALRNYSLREQTPTAWALPEASLMLRYDPNYERWRLTRRQETVHLMDWETVNALYDLVQRARMHMGWIDV